MELRELTAPELKWLYDQEMRAAFPPQELKPLSSMERMRALGRYQPLGLWEEDRLLAYALMWLAPGVPFVLLDYLGTVAHLRSQGIGSRLLDLLSRHYAGYQGIFGESEAPEAGPPQEEPLRRRRLGFYARNGFRYAGYDCALFGVHYQVLVRGGEGVSPQTLMEAHRDLYQQQHPSHIFQRYIQIPLLPGEAVRPTADWREDGAEPAK
jgi:GNAT superfamily N-acetyltransferase